MTRLMTACFGISARRAIRDYLLFSALIVFILLCIAWTIDLANSLENVRRIAAERDEPVLQILLPYLGYRATDIVLRLFPVSCFFGVFIAEIFRRHRLDTVILAASGVSPFRLIGPVLVFGITAGAFNHLLEGRWRPYAVAAQVELGIGSYADRFAKDRWFRGEHWFVFGETSIRGDVYRNSPPALENVMIFEGVRSDNLTAVYQVDRMDPIDQNGNWLAQHVVTWEHDAEIGQSIAERTFHLDLIPQELIHFSVPGFYLKTEDLRALVNAFPGSTPQVWAEVALWRRNTIGLVPFVIAVLAVSLARLAYSGRRMHFPRMIALGTAGYIFVVSLKVFFAIGEMGGLDAMVAIIAPLLGIAILGTILTLRAIWR